MQNPLQVWTGRWLLPRDFEIKDPRTEAQSSQL